MCVRDAVGVCLSVYVRAENHDMNYRHNNRTLAVRDTLRNLNIKIQQIAKNNMWGDTTVGC